MYDKKVAIVIKEGLLPWQKLNVVSFLAGSIAIQFPETHSKISKAFDIIAEFSKSAGIRLCFSQSRSKNYVQPNNQRINGSTIKMYANC